MEAVNSLRSSCQSCQENGPSDKTVQICFYVTVLFVVIGASFAFYSLATNTQYTYIGNLINTISAIVTTTSVLVLIILKIKSKNG